MRITAAEVACKLWKTSWFLFVEGREKEDFVEALAWLTDSMVVNRNLLRHSEDHYIFWIRYLTSLSPLSEGEQ